MSSLGIRRLIVWAVSLGIGFAIGWVMVVIGLPLIKSESAGITVADYGIQYFLVTSVPIGLIFVIWLDYFMDTKILPD